MPISRRTSRSTRIASTPTTLPSIWWLIGGDPVAGSLEIDYDAGIVYFVPDDGTVEDGQYTLSLHLVDSLGAATDVGPVTVDINTAAPAAPTLAPSWAFLTADSPSDSTLSVLPVQLTRPAGTVLYASGTTAPTADLEANPDGSIPFTYTWTLTPGPNDLQLTAVDKWGNASEPLTLSVNYNELTVDPLTFTVTPVDATSVTLDASLDPQLNPVDEKYNDAITTFTYYYAPHPIVGDPTADPTVLSFTTDQTSYTLSGLTPGTRYSFIGVPGDRYGSGPNLGEIPALDIVTQDTSCGPETTSFYISYEDADSSSDFSVGDSILFKFATAMDTSLIQDNSSDADTLLAPGGKSFGTLNHVKWYDSKTLRVYLTDGFTIAPADEIDVLEGFNDLAGTAVCSGDLSIPAVDDAAPIVESAVLFNTDGSNHYRIALTFSSNIADSSAPVFSALDAPFTVPSTGTWSNLGFNRRMYTTDAFDLDSGEDITVTVSGITDDFSHSLTDLKGCGSVRLTLSPRTLPTVNSVVIFNNSPDPSNRDFKIRVDLSHDTDGSTEPAIAIKCGPTVPGGGTWLSENGGSNNVYVSPSFTLAVRDPDEFHVSVSGLTDTDGAAFIDSLGAPVFHATVSPVRYPAFTALLFANSAKAKIYTLQLDFSEAMDDTIDPTIVFSQPSGVSLTNGHWLSDSRYLVTVGNLTHCDLNEPAQFTVSDANDVSSIAVHDAFGNPAVGVVTFFEIAPTLKKAEFVFNSPDSSEGYFVYTFNESLDYPDGGVSPGVFSYGDDISGPFTGGYYNGRTFVSAVIDIGQSYSANGTIQTTIGGVFAHGIGLETIDGNDSPQTVTACFRLYPNIANRKIVRTDFESNKYRVVLEFTIPMDTTGNPEISNDFLGVSWPSAGGRWDGNKRYTSPEISLSLSGGYSGGYGGGGYGYGGGYGGNINELELVIGGFKDVSGSSLHDSENRNPGHFITSIQDLTPTVTAVAIYAVGDGMFRARVAFNQVDVPINGCPPGSGGTKTNPGCFGSGNFPRIVVADMVVSDNPASGGSAASTGTGTGIDSTGTGTTGTGTTGIGTIGTGSFGPTDASTGIDTGGSGEPSLVQGTFDGNVYTTSPFSLDNEIGDTVSVQVSNAVGTLIGFGCPYNCHFGQYPVVDAFGSTTLNFTRTITGLTPAPTITTPAVIEGTHFAVSQFEIDGSRAGLYAIEVNGRVVADAFSDSDWADTENLNPNTSIDFTVLARNTDGLPSTTQTISVTEDSTAPIASFADGVFTQVPAGFYANGDPMSGFTVNFLELSSGVSPDASSISLKAAGCIPIETSVTYFEDHLVVTPTTLPPNGRYTLSVTLVDHAGNSDSQISQEFIISSKQSSPASFYSLCMDYANQPPEVQGTIAAVLDYFDDGGDCFADQVEGQRLTERDLSGSNAQDLTPLQSFTRLTYLDISDTLVDNLTPIGSLARLGEVVINGLDISADAENCPTGVASRGVDHDCEIIRAPHLLAVTLYRLSADSNEFYAAALFSETMKRPNGLKGCDKSSGPDSGSSGSGFHVQKRICEDDPGVPADITLTANDMKLDGLQHFTGHNVADDTIVVGPFTLDVDDVFGGTLPETTPVTLSGPISLASFGEVRDGEGLTPVHIDAVIKLLDPTVTRLALYEPAPVDQPGHFVIRVEFSESILTSHSVTCGYGGGYGGGGYGGGTCDVPNLPALSIGNSSDPEAAFPLSVSGSWTTDSVFTTGSFDAAIDASLSLTVGQGYFVFIDGVVAASSGNALQDFFDNSNRFHRYAVAKDPAEAPVITTPASLTGNFSTNGAFEVDGLKPMQTALFRSQYESDTLILPEGEDTDWSDFFSSLLDEEYSAQYFTVDEDGIASFRSTVQFVVDTTAPTATLSENGFDGTLRGDPASAIRVDFTESGSGIDESATRISVVDGNAIPVSLTTSFIKKCGNYVSLSPADELPDGDYILSVTPVDRAGNFGDVLTSNFTVSRAHAPLGSTYLTFNDYCLQGDAAPAGIQNLLEKLKLLTGPQDDCLHYQAALRDIASLDLSGTGNTPIDLAPLAHLVGITYLNLDGDRGITSFAPISLLPALQQLIYRIRPGNQLVDDEENCSKFSGNYVTRNKCISVDDAAKGPKIISASLFRKNATTNHYQIALLADRTLQTSAVTNCGGYGSGYGGGYGGGEGAGYGGGYAGSGCSPVVPTPEIFFTYGDQLRTIPNTGGAFGSTNSLNDTYITGEIVITDPSLPSNVTLYVSKAQSLDGYVVTDEYDQVPAEVEARVVTTVPTFTNVVLIQPDLSKNEVVARIQGNAAFEPGAVDCIGSDFRNGGYGGGYGGGVHCPEINGAPYVKIGVPGDLKRVADVTQFGGDFTTSSQLSHDTYTTEPFPVHLSPSKGESFTLHVGDTVSIRTGGRNVRDTQRHPLRDIFGGTDVVGPITFSAVPLGVNIRPPAGSAFRSFYEYCMGVSSTPAIAQSVAATLKYLGVTDCLAAQAALSAATSLSITDSDPPITDVSIFANLTNLRSLDLRDNQITDLSPLENLLVLQHAMVPPVILQVFRGGGNPVGPNDRNCPLRPFALLGCQGYIAGLAGGGSGDGTGGGTVTTPSTLVLKISGGSASAQALYPGDALNNLFFTVSGSASAGATVSQVSSTCPVDGSSQPLFALAASPARLAGSTSVSTPLFSCQMTFQATSGSTLSNIVTVSIKEIMPSPFATACLAIIGETTDPVLLAAAKLLENLGLIDCGDADKARAAATSLDLSNGGAKDLAGFLEGTEDTLTDLDLHGNGLTNADLTTLKGFQLVTLNLGGNSISDVTFLDGDADMTSLIIDYDAATGNLVCSGASLNPITTILCIQQQLKNQVQ